MAFNWYILKATVKGGAYIHLISSKGSEINYAVKLAFKVSNNEAECDGTTTKKLARLTSRSKEPSPHREVKIQALEYPSAKHKVMEVK